MAEIKQRTRPKPVKPENNKIIDKAVKKVVEEYGETLVLLGKE